MILDTTVLVDVQKEVRRGKPGAATRLLETSGDAPVFIAFVTWMVSRNEEHFRRVPGLSLRAY
jgi:hypothetical protein